ncbi:hypothetical protein FOA43_004621 [Brettanomyces nanus]|uniref:SURF1-like protein n=1 Tax=Eeniella nana TaxID=13502 RepID=A0A875SF18_EENNA|nr:uncharacterized protein FOA43_004621 [Brettanomyces nanus]QPG77214.1 hypothetical protein FOA43_004621 [Brettanomyces nanus]
MSLLHSISPKLVFKMHPGIRPRFLTPLTRRYATVKTPNIDWDPMMSVKDINKDDKGSFSHKAVFALLCIAPVLTFGLGVWQVKRLKWKTKLVNSSQDRLSYPAIKLPKNLTDEEIVKGLAYRKVYVTGKYDYSREIFIGPRLKEGREGYIVVCPFVQSNGTGEVLVERGWISADKIIPSRRRLRHLSCPEKEITIEAVIKDPPKRGIMQMKHHNEARLFEFLDIDAMVKQSGTRHIYLQAVEDFHDRPEWKSQSEESEKMSSWFSFLKKKDQLNAADKQIEQLKTDVETSDATEFSSLQFMDAGVPVGKIPIVEYRNTHMQYLITWFSLSLASTILLVLMIRKGKWVDPNVEKLKFAKKHS